jgi:hypothetical protein
MSNIINASTSAGLIHTADTSGTIELQSNGTTKFTVSSTGAYGQVVSGTAVASTSGTSIDFTSIPSWVKRITVMFSGVSTNGTSNLQIQIGSGSVDTTGYTGGQAAVLNANTTGAGSITTGFAWNTAGSASTSVYGTIVLTFVSGNIWVANGNGWDVQGSRGMILAGGKTLSGTLDRVRITTFNGTDTFDAGSINILYEG